MFLSSGGSSSSAHVDVFNAVAVGDALLTSGFFFLFARAIIAFREQRFCVRYRVRRVVFQFKLKQVSKLRFS